MTLPIVWLPEADAELKETLARYESIRPELGMRFAEAVEETIEAIVASPLRFAAVDKGRRRAGVRRFPVNIALRHPKLFRKVVAFSGRYDLTRPFGVFPDLFRGYYDQDIYFHTPTHFLPGLSEDSTLSHLRRLDITLTVGEHDPFCESTWELSRILHDKSIPHQVLIWQGEAHRAHCWRLMAPLYLSGRRS